MHVGGCTVRPGVSQIGHPLHHSLSAYVMPPQIGPLPDPHAFLLRATCVAYGLHCSLETVADGIGSYFLVLTAASCMASELTTCSSLL